MLFENWKENLEPLIEKTEKNYNEMREVMLTSGFNNMGLAIVFHEVEHGVRSLYRTIEHSEDINLIKLSGAISICDCFISNDTGPVHIAAALQISTLTLFSTGNDFNVGALSNKKQSIKNVNINKITVNEVIEKLNNLI